VLVVTAVFANLAEIATRSRGMAPLRTLVLPHPMETRSHAEIESLAMEHLPSLQQLLTRQPAA
jgi:hypothetical protein